MNTLPQALRQADPLGPHWSRSPAVRLFLGILLAQGTAFALGQFLRAGLLLADQDLSLLTEDVTFVFLVQGLQLLALLVGCLFVGAGEASAAIYGLLAGGLNGFLTLVLVMSQQNGRPIDPVTLYSQPVLHLAFGLFGALLGAWLWPPLPQLAPLGDLQLSASPLDRPGRRLRTAGGKFQLDLRVAWLRVLVGTAVVVAGLLSADAILRYALAIRDLQETLRTQQRLFTFQVGLLAAFLGGGFAGSNTTNGAVHGVCVGLISASLFLGCRFSDLIRPATQLDDFTHAAVLAGIAAFAGWMGSAVLPPVLKYPTAGRGPREA